MMRYCILLLAILLQVTAGFNKVNAQDYPNVPGVVVAHSPASSKIYIGAPSMAILPNGDYLISYHEFGPNSTNAKKGLTRICRSADKGKSWKQIAEINGAIWSKLFVHRGALYLIGMYRHNGNMVIRKSTDDGRTWTEPVDKNTGLLFKGKYKCAATPVVEYNGRLWRAMQDAMGDVDAWGKQSRVFMISAAVDADLLKSASWTQTNPLGYDSSYLNGNFGGWVEGNAVLGPDHTIYDVLRVDDRSTLEQKVALVKISADGKTASFDEKDFVPFPGGSAKFTIQYDAKTKLYWTLSNYIPDEVKKTVAAYPEKNGPRRSSMIRNTLALCSSADLRDWKVNKIILQTKNIAKTGFSYVDWQFDGDDIVFVSRTAFDDGVGGANSCHNTNFITSHRISEFRKNRLPEQLAHK